MDPHDFAWPGHIGWIPFGWNNFAKSDVRIPLHDTLFFGFLCLKFLGQDVGAIVLGKSWLLVWYS